MYYNSYKKLEGSDQHWLWDSHGVRDPQEDIKMDHPLLKSSPAIDPGV